jgi:hypothetical protein
MKIKNWDKLRYKFVSLAGANLTIDTTWDEVEGDKVTYCLTMCDVDNVGDTLISVRLQSGAFDDEFLMKVELEQPKITPNINRVFRPRDLMSMDEFLVNMCNELMKNTMVYSFISLLSDVQNKRLQHTMRAPSSHSLSF